MLLQIAWWLWSWLSPMSSQKSKGVKRSSAQVAIKLIWAFNFNFRLQRRVVNGQRDESALCSIKCFMRGLKSLNNSELNSSPQLNEEITRSAAEKNAKTRKSLSCNWKHLRYNTEKLVGKWEKIKMQLFSCLFTACDALMRVWLSLV